MADFARPTAEDRYRMTRAAQRVLRNCGSCGTPTHIRNLTELKSAGLKVCPTCHEAAFEAALIAAGVDVDAIVPNSNYCDHGEPNDGADCIACAMWEKVR